MSFFSELRRRNVFKVAAAYAIVGWLLIEITSTVFPIVQLPDWTITLVTMLLILGFPIALILSWAYELTPEGMKRTQEVPARESITQATGRKINVAIIAALVLTLGFVVVDNYVLHSGSAEASRLPNSVAVLPFENLSPDPDNAYFAAGIHEEVLNQLVKLRNLSVISRTSVVRYADSDLTIPEIADALNVKTVLEGSVRYSDGRVRIAAQLIDADTDEHLWSEVYERDFSDVFAIQADIAMNIANALEAEFSLTEQARIEQSPTDSPAAYALYLQALSVMYPDAISGQRILDRAIALDPEFTLAYATKANLYATSLVDTFAGATPNSEERPELERLARDNAEQALMLDDNLGLAHLALAYIDIFSWRWSEARRALQRALRVDPNNAQTLQVYSYLNSYSGRHAEALRAGHRAAELEPTPTSYFWLGVALAGAGELENSAAALRSTTELGPQFGVLHAWLGHVLIGLGDTAEALDELEISEQLQRDNIAPNGVAILLYGHTRLGRREAAERLFERLQSLSDEGRPVGAGTWAEAHLALGNTERALEWLRVSVEKIENQEPDEGFYNLMEIKTNAWSDPG